MQGFGGKKAVVLGGLGFIGSSLALRLVDLGADVTVVDSMISNYGGNLFNIEPARDKIHVNYADIRDVHALPYILKDKDIIYSVAGQTSHVDSMTDPMTDLDINCRSQLTILEACRKYNPTAIVVYASTRQLYGKPEYLPVDEGHPIKPVDINGINNLAAEMYYHLYAQVYNLNCVALRLTNTYGPRQQLRGNSQGFVGIFIRKALRGEGIQVFGDGSQKRDFNYVDDVVEAFIRATGDSQLYGKSFNLGDTKVYSLLDFVEVLQKHCDFEFATVPFPEDHKAIDIGDYYANYDLFHSLTGWRPGIELEEGLGRTVAYFRKHIDKYC